MVRYIWAVSLYSIFATEGEQFIGLLNNVESRDLFGFWIMRIMIIFEKKWEEVRSVEKYENVSIKLYTYI